MTDTFLDQAATLYERDCLADARRNPPVRINQTVAVYRNLMDGRSTGYGRVVCLYWNEDEMSWFAQVQLAKTQKLKTINTTLLEPARFQKSQMAHWFKALNNVGEFVTALAILGAVYYVPWLFYMHTGHVMRFG